MKNTIKFFIMDVDGTLTDGKIYMSDHGELFKAFDVKDGCGIKDILIPAGMIPVVITARNSKILENRCKELSITKVYQGIQDKIRKVDEILMEQSQQEGITYTYRNCAYIGDDILDLQCMNLIREFRGLIGCPVDAVKKVKDIADFISDKKGGYGAVREFIEWILDN